MLSCYSPIWRLCRDLVTNYLLPDLYYEEVAKLLHIFRNLFAPFWIILPYLSVVSYRRSIYDVTIFDLLIIGCLAHVLCKWIHNKDKFGFFQTEILYYYFISSRSNHRQTLTLIYLFKTIQRMFLSSSTARVPAEGIYLIHQVFYPNLQGIIAYHNLSLCHYTVHKYFNKLNFTIHLCFIPVFFSCLAFEGNLKKHFVRYIVNKFSIVSSLYRNLYIYYMYTWYKIVLYLFISCNTSQLVIMKTRWNYLQSHC